MQVEGVYDEQAGKPLTMELKRGLVSLFQFQTQAGTVTEVQSRVSLRTKQKKYHGTWNPGIPVQLNSTTDIGKYLHAQPIPLDPKSTFTYHKIRSTFKNTTMDGFHWSISF